MTDKFISRIKLIRFSFPVFVLSLFMLASCKDDPAGLGSDFIPGDNNPDVSLDTTEIILNENIFRDSLLVQAIDSSLVPTTINKRDTVVWSFFPSINYNVLGEFKDKLFGTSTAGLMFEIRPPGYQKIDQTKVNTVLSLRLYLEKAVQNGARPDTVILGKKDAMLRYQLYSLKNSIGFRNFYSNIDPQQYIDRELVLNENELTSANDSLRFDIGDPDLIQLLLQNTRDSLTMVKDSLFHNNVFKGFYLKSSYPFETGGALFTLNTTSTNSYLEMRIKSDKDTLTLKYYVRQVIQGVSNYSLTGSQFSSDPDHFYLQGLGGPYLKMNIPRLDSLRTKWKPYPVSVYKAEIILTPDSSFLAEKGVSAKDYPDYLYLSLDNPENPVVDDVLFGNSSYYGGNYINGTYKFNITRYFHRFIKENLTNSSFILKVENNKSNAKSGIFDAGRVAFKKSGGIKLRIIYSKLN